MTGIKSRRRPDAPEMRVLTADEIDLVAGGKGFGGSYVDHHHDHGSPSIGGGGFAAVIANALATGNSTFTETITRAVTIGNISAAFGFGIAIGIGPGSSAGISITTVATS